ncbi:helix-turn-helix transcriptional regulator [Pseudonocardia xinjiangensis]|uniref:helix-turn-helix transcriptional regulator n=1 Tax=Pseudonocardia xinjiangensis TaxID=75289 RepID=UPI003D8E8988
MRADRLLSLLLLLQHRGRMTAPALARELEVSTRTVLRDVDALSAAGVPVYAERGRHGGFALLPGYTTDLTGLTHDEALALLVAGSQTAPPPSGGAPALASAMRKVVAALPQQRRAAATRDAGRILVRREGMVGRTHGPAAEAPDDEERLAVVRGAVFAGRRLRVHYAASGEEARWRTVDPVGLVNARGRWYLLATRDGADRTYRLSRILAVEELAEAADRPAGVDLQRAWEERRARFAATMAALTVTVRVRSHARGALVRSVRQVIAEQVDGDGWLRLELEFTGLDHALGAVWALGPDAEAIEPPQLRAAVVERAAATAARYVAAATLPPSGAPTGPVP